MVAESRPRCTICGVPVSQAGTVLVHVDDGHTSAWRPEPYGHHATLAPVNDGAR